MYVTDPIADMLTRIRNALVTRKREVDMPASTMKKAIAQILLDEGYISNFKVEDTENHQGRLLVMLKYGPGGQKVIQGIKRISKPGLRVYAKQDDIPKVLGGLGIVIISTSKGIMTDREARKQSVGGEVLAFVW
jgi:small subunit ribosomal protein S8